MIKRILTILAIITMGLAIAMLIGAIFGMPIFTNPYLKILISLGTVAVASGLSINSVNLYAKKRVIPLISLIFLLISVILFLIIIWSDLLISNSLFVKTSFVIGIASIFFNIIVSVNVRLYKKYTILQLFTYALLIFIDVTISLSFFGTNLFLINNFVEIFSAICLVAFALLITLSILGKKFYALEDNHDSGQKGTIKIKLEEYEAMKNHIKELEQKLKK